MLSTALVAPKKHSLSSHATTGELVRRARNLRGLTQKQLAEAIGSGQSYITDLEHDKFSPGLEKMRQIAGVLDMPVRELIGESDTNIDEAVRQSLSRIAKGESKR